MSPVTEDAAFEDQRSHEGLKTKESMAGKDVGRRGGQSNCYLSHFNVCKLRLSPSRKGKQYLIRTTLSCPMRKTEFIIFSALMIFTKISHSVY